MTSRPVRIAVQIQPQHASYERMRDAVREAEDLGVDVIFTWDHFFPLNGDADGKHFECWTTLAAWAEQTSRVQLGALVTCNGYRNPDLLADMARTVDHISGGRLILGIGSGWAQRDFDSYGFEFGSTGSRLDDLAAALPRIESRWAALNPPPTGPMPILIGGEGEQKTLRMVAEHASIWHSFSGPDKLAHKLQVLRSHCDAVGRDLDEIEVSVGVGGRGREGRSAGDPEVEGQPLLDLGARLFTHGANGPDYDFTVLRRWIAWRDALNG
ncbi:LLM class F420-dependent oxidoreductase [Flexivirga oryzae]|uniref:Putative F420-dependent oxidoreductase n=1 Tax=Flexivirga oryzae TaxID=1794944 RepID=A0A839NC15_9MICO|nr:LLM class F420-dependent oxidoreductase [Flexivirga oryzae]MBB2892261.1 putative F420-dependent oxidoreductase [Flexivirga oryzae]